MIEADVKSTSPLEGLARERFGNLTEPELKLLRAAAKGVRAHFGDPAMGRKEEVNNPSHADTWSGDHDIRGEFIRWLCIDPGATACITPLGIRAQSANIIGGLDLSYAVVPFPLSFLSCKFADPLHLTLAELRLLDLSGSATSAVLAIGVHIRGPVVLREGFSAEGELFFKHTKIGGDFECHGGTLKNPNDVALDLQHANIEGSVYLRDGFIAEGEVRLYGTSIAGDLDCGKGAFKNPQAVAIRADGAKIAGSVVLHAGFSSRGEVRLNRATIGGIFDCQKADFKNTQQDGVALNAELASISGAVLLRDGFSAEGEVRFYAASVGSNLDCDSGSFNGDTVALNAELARVGGAVLARQGFSAEGEVSLYGATIGGNVAVRGGRFNSIGEGATALSLELAKIERAVFMNHGFVAVGRVVLGGSSIAGDLNVAGAKFENTYLDIQRASAGALRGEPASWPKARNLLLDGFSYARLADTSADSARLLQWLRLQRSPGSNNAFSPQPYQHLAKVLLEQGHETTARKVLIGLEDDRRKNGGLTVPRKLWAETLRWTIAYGYNPLQALLWIAVFVLVGSVVFGMAYQAGQLVPSEKEAYESFKVGQLPRYYDRFCALVYSFDTFVPIIDLGQRSRWKPIDTEHINPERNVLKLPDNDETNDIVCAICDPAAFSHWRVQMPTWFPRFYRWLNIVAGWFFTGLFAAGVSGLVRHN